MRLIDKDELLRLIDKDKHRKFIDKDELLNMIYEINSIVEFDGRPITEVYIKGEKYEKAQHKGWIPCSERLPKYDGEMYLVTDYCEQINRRRIHVSYCYANRDGFWSDVPIGYKVIAWKPLPEPYREDGEE